MIQMTFAVPNGTKFPEDDPQKFFSENTKQGYCQGFKSACVGFEEIPGEVRLLNSRNVQLEFPKAILTIPLKWVTKVIATEKELMDRLTHTQCRALELKGLIK